MLQYFFEKANLSLNQNELGKFSEIKEEKLLVIFIMFSPQKNVRKEILFR